MKSVLSALGFSREISLTAASRLRVMTALAAVLYPVWGLLYHYLDPNFQDSILERLAISLFFTCVFLSSYSKRFKPYFDVLFVTNIWLLTTHYMGLVAVNKGHYLYLSGAYLVIMAVLSAFPSRRSIYFFTGYLMLLSVYIAKTTEGFLTDSSFFLFGIFTCLLVGLASQSTLLSIIQKLHDSEELNSKMLSNLVEGVILQDKSGAIRSVNNAAPQILGLTKDQLLCRTSIDPSWKCVKEDGTEFPGHEHPSMVSLSTGKPQKGIVMGVFKPNGSLSWISVNSIPLFHENQDEPHGVLVSYHDITEQKESAKILIEQQALIANSARISSLGVMASGIAHEINNPLAIISGRVSQLSRMITDQKVKPEAMWPIVKNIEHTVQRISKIIHGLKAFSRDGHADPFVITPVQQVVDDAVVVTKEILNRRGIELIINIQPDIIFDGRSVQITQVLVNLIQNAADAIENLETTKWIKVSASEDGTDYVEITVEDSGNGVPKEIQDRIMEPFFTTKQVGKGTGLGLSISSGIINSHNGSLYIDVDVPNTKFIISLPKSQSKAASAA